MIEVRYFSRGGNTKALAEGIATALSVEAKDISAPATMEFINTLFIGGALYAYGIDKKLSEYLDTLTNDKVQRAVVFSTSWISKHAIALIKKKLTEKNIIVVDESIYNRGKPSIKDIKKAQEKALRIVSSL